MKIGLIGYGKMGRMVEQAALCRGHTVVARTSTTEWDIEALQKADICMEFTHPGCVIDNVRRLAELKKQIIIGTTGWHDKVDTVRSLVEENNIGAVYASNFSTGMQLMLNVLDYASQVINSFEEYDVAGIEHHHNQKKDAPSGAAMDITRVIEGNIERLDKLPFASVRCGSIPGTHTILFDSPHDTLSITHQARNREGFAEGAVRAAEWLQGRKGLYTYADCMKEIIQRRQP